jgi:acyl carrier protein
MATREEVRAAAVAVLGGIAPEADLAAVGPDVPLRRALDLDSVDFQNFLIGLTHALGVDIPDREAAALTTLAACMDRLAGEPDGRTPGDAGRPGG